MDLSSLAGGNNAAEKEQAPALEYTAQVASPLLNGEAKLVVGQDGLAITTLMDAAEIPYADMLALGLDDYMISVKTAGGVHTFSRMGNWCEPYYSALYEAYNRKVLKALFVVDKPVLQTKGQYRINEDGLVFTGHAPVSVHENAVCILPPDIHARRIPLCFMTGLLNQDYTVTLRLDTGESYAFSKLGYDTEPFTDTIGKQVRKLREKTLAAVMELDPAISSAQASAMARLMPEGAAAPMGLIASQAPSFAQAIEKAVEQSRAGKSYLVFKEICDEASIYVGFKKNVERSGGEGGGLTDIGAMTGMLGGGAAALQLTSENAKPVPFMLWMIAPSPNGRFCAVEFAGGDGAAAATFVYRCKGPFEAFAGMLNRALEAVAFKREIIRLSDAELMQREHADDRMAVERTAAIQFIRSCFAGRVIHNSPAAWKTDLLQLWEGIG